ncbi:MAG: BTAD domain-containing putative transcriptional regulator [Gemmatimonadaceae bacterium]
MLQIKSLGELRLANDGRASDSHLRRKPLALLCYIARRAPHQVSRTELATLFWGERGEDRARQSLRQALAELKHALGDKIDVDVDTVRLSADAVELDINTFERDVADGRIAAAVERWTGDFFDGGEDIGGEGFRRWIEGERQALHQLLAIAMEKLVGDAELQGDWPRAATVAERWAEALPLDERAHLRLIEVYRMCGRNGDALRTHAAFVARVHTVLDLEPSVEFQRLGGGLAETARTDLARQGRGSAALRTPTLVGRGAVMRELSDSWTAALSGPGVVVAVRGEAGSGLTRVCDELEERVRGLSRDCVVLRARGTGPEPALGSAAALFDGLRSASGSAGASPEALSEVARLVPALRAQFQHLPDPVGDDTALRDGLLQVIGAIAEEQPLLMIVDDLQTADIPSRRLIASLAVRLPKAAMLVVAKVEGPPAYPGAPDDMLASRSMLRLHLGELTAGDVDAVVGSMLTMAPSERRVLSERVHAEAGGLPQPVVAVIAALVDEQLLRVTADGTWHASPALAGRPLPIPSAVRERTRVRLERLTPAAKAAAEALALVSEASDMPILAAAAELSRDDADAALGELTLSRMVRESTDAPGRFAFATTLLSRTVAALTPHTRREALHARIAQALADRELGATAERSLLSYHLARAPRPDASAPSPPAPTPWFRRRTVVAAGAVLTILMAAAFDRLGRGGATASDQVPVVALGHIADYRPTVGAELARPLSDMLATNLGRVSRLQVVSSARMYELMNQAGNDTTASALVAAHERAGATEMVDGALYARDDGGFRLDLRRVELKGGSIRQTYSIVGHSLFELADSGTAKLAADLGSESPTGSVADVTTRSLAAYRLYEQGLRLYFATDFAAAEPCSRPR